MAGFGIGHGFGPNHRARMGAAGPAAPSLPAMTSLAGFGDSITVGQQASDAAHQWLNIVAAGVGAGTPLNQGIAGTVLQNSNDSGGGPRSNNGRDRFVSALLGGNKKDGVCIAYGFNDARYTAAPTTFNLTQYRNDLREVLNGLVVGGYARNKIVVVSPYWISDTGLTTGSAGFTGQTRGGFEAFVSAAHDVAGEYGVWYADSYGAMRDGGGASLIHTDNIHPIDAGHAVIAQAVLNASMPNGTSAPTGVALSSAGAGLLSLAFTAPAGAVTNYTAEFGAEGSYAYGNSQTASGSTAAWSGVADGVWRARVCANFADGSVSPWAFSAGTVTLATAIFGQDNFTDTSGTAITAHTPQAGGAWTLQSGYSPASPNAIDGANRLWSPTTTGVYRLTATPPSADYFIEADLVKVSTISGDNVGVCGRMQAAANTLYFARWSESAAGWQLYKTVAGTSTQLGSTYSDTFTVGATKTVRLTMSGSTISLSVGGVVRVSVTDTAISGAGFAGVRFGSIQTATTGVHMDAAMASV